MANTDFSSVNNTLRNDPQYQAALRGELNVAQFPVGADGKVLPGYRKENARAYAEGKLGRANVPAGAIDDGGTFYDPNADHWYSDPRFWGPVAVAASVPLFSALHGATAAATAGSHAVADGLIPNAANPAEWAGIAAPTATEGVPALGTIVAGEEVARQGLGQITQRGNEAANGASVADRLKNWITDPKNIAGLVSTVPAMIAAGNAGDATNPLNDPTVQQLLQMNLKRQQRVDPLHDSITQLSMAMLPTAYQKRG